MAGLKETCPTGTNNQPQTSLGLPPVAGASDLTLAARDRVYSIVSATLAFIELTYDPPSDQAVSNNGTVS
jgi:hypothetical protein